VLIQLNDDGDFKNRKIVLAEALIESVIKDCEIKDFKEIKKFKGKDLKNTICNHPFLSKICNNRAGNRYRSLCTKSWT